MGSWHIIVGKKFKYTMKASSNLKYIGTNFGSFVTYEHKCMILFWLEHIGFLIFKHG